MGPLSMYIARLVFILFNEISVFYHTQAPTYYFLHAHLLEYSVCFYHSSKSAKEIFSEKKLLDKAPGMMKNLSH